MSAPALTKVRVLHFSPNGGAADFLYSQVDAAKTILRIAAYQLTNPILIQKICEAKSKRGLDVEVVLDPSMVPVKWSPVPILQKAGIPVWIDAKHHIMHLKVIIIDNAIVITGSYNFSNAAEHSNAENLIAIPDATLAKQYMDNWQVHKSHSTLPHQTIMPEKFIQEGEQM